MFGKKGFMSQDTFSTLVGKNSVPDGGLHCEGAVKVDGTIHGAISCSGNVYISSGAIVKGNITGASVVVGGDVEGNIYTKGMLKILSSAALSGDVEIGSFVADEGAVFKGKCTMLKTEPVTAAPVKPTVSEV